MIKIITNSLKNIIMYASLITLCGCVSFFASNSDIFDFNLDHQNATLLDFVLSRFFLLPFLFIFAGLTLIVLNIFKYINLTPELFINYLTWFFTSLLTALSHFCFKITMTSYIALKNHCDTIFANNFITISRIWSFEQKVNFSHTEAQISNCQLSNDEALFFANNYTSLEKLKQAVKYFCDLKLQSTPIIEDTIKNNVNILDKISGFLYDNSTILITCTLAAIAVIWGVYSLNNYMGDAALVATRAAVRQEMAPAMAVARHSEALFERIKSERLEYQIITGNFAQVKDLSNLGDLKQLNNIMIIIQKSLDITMSTVFGFPSQHLEHLSGPSETQEVIRQAFKEISSISHLLYWRRVHPYGSGFSEPDFGVLDENGVLDKDYPYRV